MIMRLIWCCISLNKSIKVFTIQLQPRKQVKLNCIGFQQYKAVNDVKYHVITRPPGTVTLWWRGLRVPVNLRAVLSGALCSWSGLPWQSDLRGAILRMVHI